MLVLSTVLTASLLTVANAQLDGVWSVEMWRALQRPPNGKEQFKLSNNNLGDIVGVVRYLMQEVLPEHTQANSSRAARKNDIDAIALYRMKVRNPGSLTSQPTLMPVPGFGPYGAFDYGISSDPNQLQTTVTLGDYVGADVEDSGQIKYSRKWYWYSVDGFCPNLPWKCIPPYPGCPGAVPDIVPVSCQATGCAGKTDKAAEVCKKDSTYHDPNNKTLLTECCLRYAADDTHVIQGGLCPESADRPAGVPGCVYQYENLTEKSYVMLDDIVGIPKLACGTNGERKCKDWLDWRKNCHDPNNEFHKKFQCEDCVEGGAWTTTIVNPGYCVEYDIHPKCQSSAKLCDDPDCQKLPTTGQMPKELGLPFWRGKCDPKANTKRAEYFANAIIGNETKGKHTVVNATFTKDNPQCASLDPTKPNNCVPNPPGGPYCTQTWAGICSTCYIPGTNPPYADAAAMPMCPFNISKEHGVKIAKGTVCKSKNPSDLCCLYGVPGFACDGPADPDPETAPFDDNTYFLFMAKANTSAMTTWAKRWVKQQGGTISDANAFSDMMYWSWSPHPYEGLSFTIMKDDLRASTAISWPNSPTPPPGDKPGGLGAGAIVAIIAGVIIVLGIGGFAFAKYRKRAAADAQARNMALLGQQTANTGNQAAQQRI